MTFFVVNLGPATTDAAMQSSVNSSLANTRPKLMISTKRKPVAETVSTTSAMELQFVAEKLNTKSSIMSRLGKPATCSSQSGVVIPTKRKLVDVTTALAIADRLAAKLITKPSVESRLGEPVVSNPLQQRLMISTKAKQVVEMAVKTEMQPARKLSMKSRLGERAQSAIQTPIMIPTKRKSATAGGDYDSYVVPAKYQAVFSRLGPKHM